MKKEFSLETVTYKGIRNPSGAGVGVKHNGTGPRKKAFRGLRPCWCKDYVFVDKDDLELGFAEIVFCGYNFGVVR